MSSGQRRALMFLGIAVFIVLSLLMLPPPERASDEGLTPLFPRLEPSAIQGIHLQRPAWDGPVVLQRSDDGWWMDSPYSARADRVQVEALVGAMADAELRGPIQTDDASLFGLGPGQGIRVSLDDGPRRRELVVGAETIDGGSYIIQDGTIMASTNVLTHGIPPDADALRDRMAVHGVVDDAQEIELRYAGRELLAQAEGEGWSCLLDGLPWAEGADRPAALLRWVATLRVAEFAAEGWDPSGAVATLALRDATGHELELVLEEPATGARPRASVPCCTEPVTLERGSFEELLGIAGLQLGSAEAEGR